MLLITPFLYKSRDLIRRPPACGRGDHPQPPQGQCGHRERANGFKLRKEYGSFKGWLDAHHPLTKEEWTKLFKKTFVFTGGEIVNEFLMSTGYLPGAHDKNCPVFKKVASLRPACVDEKQVKDL
jgi:hypothetical protein